MTIRAVGFDYGGVVSGLPGGYFDAQVATLLNVSVEDYRQVYFLHNKKLMSANQIWQLVLADLGKESLYEQLCSLISSLNKAKTINSDILDLVKKLRDSGCKVGLQSNNSKEKANLMRAQGLEAYFDVLCISAEIGYSKPDKRAFSYLASELGVEMQELVFIDDEPTSLKNSERDGYKPILFKSYKQLIKGLALLGLV